MGMDIQGQSPKWDLPLPETVRQNADKNLSTRLAQVADRIKELNQTKSATTLSSILNTIGVGKESREIKKLNKLDKELLQTYSALKKETPAIEPPKNLSQLILCKQNEINDLYEDPDFVKADLAAQGLMPFQKQDPKHTELLNKMDTLKSQLKGLNLIKEIEQVDSAVSTAGITPKSNTWTFRLPFSAEAIKMKFAGIVGAIKGFGSKTDSSEVANKRLSVKEYSTLQPSQKIPTQTPTVTPKQTQNQEPDLLKTLVASDSLEADVEKLTGSERLEVTKKLSSMGRESRLKYQGATEEKLNLLETALKECSGRKAGVDLVGKLMRGETIKNGRGQMVPVSTLYCLTSKSVVETPLLFTLVLEKLKDPNLKPTEKLALLRFCNSWVNANMATKEFAKLKPKEGEDHILKQIAGAVSSDSGDDIKSICANLIKAADATNIQPEYHLVMPNGEESMMAILSNLRSNKFTEKEYSNLASKLADDLFLINAAFYRELTQDVLAEDKWAGDKHPLLAKMNAFSTKYSNVMKAHIIKESDPAEQLKIIELCIRQAHACLSRGDLQGMVTLLGTINDTDIAALKDVYGNPLVDSLKPEVQKMRTQVIAMNSPEGNFKAPREKLAELRGQNKPCIPFMGLVMQDLTFIRDGNPAVTASANSDESFNESKLSFIDNTIGDALVFQGRVGDAVQKIKVSTDLYRHINNAEEYDLESLIARRKDSEATNLFSNLTNEERKAATVMTNVLLEQVDVDTFDIKGLSRPIVQQVQLKMQALREQAKVDAKTSYNELSNKVELVLKGELSENVKDALLVFQNAKSDTAIQKRNAVKTLQEAIADDALAMEFADAIKKAQADLIKIDQMDAKCRRISDMLR